MLPHAILTFTDREKRRACFAKVRSHRTSSLCAALTGKRRSRQGGDGDDDDDDDDRDDDSCDNSDDEAGGDDVGC